MGSKDSSTTREESKDSTQLGWGRVRRLKELELGHSENREERSLGPEAGDEGSWQVDRESNFLKTLNLCVILKMKLSLQAVSRTKTLAVKGWLTAWLTDD